MSSALDIPVANLAKDNGSPEQNDKFWTHADIVDYLRWNQNYPYQLILVKRDGDQYIRDNEANKWNFTLPISPTSVSFDMPFAIRAGAQLDGFYEQHGGAPVRNITMQGTTGVLPLKGSTQTRNFNAALGGIFAGTLAAAQRTAQSATGITVKPNIVSDDEFLSNDNEIAKTSGYAQFRRLQEFFENYVAFKKSDKGRDYMLALAIWKDEAIYLVTPTRFTVARSAESPYEYPYQLAFRAWKRIKLNQSGPSANLFRPVTRDASKLGKMLQSIDQARRVLEGARDTIAAVGGDIEHTIFEPLRELTFWVKDLLGIPYTIADLPVQIARDCKDAIVTAVGVMYLAQGVPDAFTNASQEAHDTFVSIADLASQTDQTTTGGINYDPHVNVPNPLVVNQYYPASSHIGNTVFEDISDNYEFFNLINFSQLNVSPVLVRAVINERDRIRQKTRLDFEQQRDTMVQALADFSDLVGAGNSTFTSTYSRPTVTTTRIPSLNDYQIMFHMNRVIMELNRLAASGETNRFKIDSLNYVAGFATRSGIAFNVPTSKFAVPMPYGMTLEQLSTRYLGTPDRWIEIATLNGLRAPYVDEVGFDLPLLVNAQSTQVEVADSTNLFVGQQVWISSTTTTRTSGNIVYIEKISDTRSVIGINAPIDLSVYTTLAQATLHAFLPDTVNSMMQIYIPSDEEPADDDYKSKSIPGINYFDPLVEAAGVDVLLTESLDLAITPDGDCRLAVGLANVVQTARIRLSTPQGTLNRHPNFGLAIAPGVSTADVDAQALLDSCKNLFSDDPTFTGVTSAFVQKQGPGTTIAITVGVQGVVQPIPIGFKLQG